MPCRLIYLTSEAPVGRVTSGRPFQEQRCLDSQKPIASLNCFGVGHSSVIRPFSFSERHQQHLWIDIELPRIVIDYLGSTNSAGLESHFSP